MASHCITLIENDIQILTSPKTWIFSNFLCNLIIIKINKHSLNTFISVQTEAESQPSDAQRKLLAAAKLLADATARMVEAARQCASSPQVRYTL